MLVAALEGDEHVGETYEIGGPETLTLRQVTDLVYEAERKGVTIVPLPMPLARIGLTVLGAVPGFPMGPDQYRSLQFDNTTADNDVAAFGVDPDELTTLGAHLGVR
jgi:NADH dehydrogenase